MLKLREKIINFNYFFLKAGVLYFFIYGFLGWVVDSCDNTLEAGHLVFGGMFLSFRLPVPFAPIYGFGALAIILFIKKLRKFSPFVLALTAGFISTAVEYVGGEMTVAIFGHRAWDYSNNFLNFRGHIDLAHSIAWMMVGLIFVKIIHPTVARLVKKFLSKPVVVPIDKN